MYYVYGISSLPKTYNAIMVKYIFHESSSQIGGSTKLQDYELLMSCTNI